MAGRSARRPRELADAGRVPQLHVAFGGQLGVGVGHAEQHVALVGFGSGWR
jgi:hypothetical protein